MRLRPDQLDTHLKRSSTTPIYFVSGDEPLQKLECIDLIRKHYRGQGYDERIIFNVDKSFNWNSINEVTRNLSLFSSQRIIELRMDAPKPGREGGGVLQEFAEKENDDTLLIISSDKMDKSTQNNKWTKSIDKVGVMIQVWPIEPAQLPGWIQGRIQKKQKKITQDAARLIAERVEGNLLAAQQEIEKLVLLIEKNLIDIEDVIGAVADSSRYNVFDMIESAFLGNIDRTLLMLNGLKNEGTEPLALFGALMWEYRRLCSIAYEYEAGTQLENIFKSYRIWDQKKRSITAVLKRHSSKSLDQLLNYCAAIDKTLKSGHRDRAWDQFNVLLLAIAGINTNKLQIS
jgi:DNA polymerase-3 subunit delta